jgi:hypothetical protein
MQASSYKTFVYMETVLIPHTRISVATGVGMPATATIIIPPCTWGSRLIPGTRVTIFIQVDNDPKLIPYFIGKIDQNPSMTIGIGDKSITIFCVSHFISLSKANINGLGITEMATGAVGGDTKLIIGSGEIKIPQVDKSLGLVQMWGPLINNATKAKIIRDPLDVTSMDQSLNALSAKGKIFSLLQTVLLSSTLTRDELRRTRYLDRLGMYINEDASNMINNQGPDNLLSKNIVAQIFQGRKSGWQILQEYTSLFQHDVVSVCPLLKATFDVPLRGEMGLPPDSANYLLAQNGKIPKMTDYMGILGCQDSFLECLIKPNMIGTYPPTSNVISPEQYSYFSFNKPKGLTRMAVKVPHLPGITSVILEPPALENAYHIGIKFGDGKSTDASAVNLSSTMLTRGSDYITNEERIIDHMQYNVTQMNPLVQNTIGKNASPPPGEKELIEEMATFLANNTCGDTTGFTVESLSQMLVTGRGVPINAAMAAAKKIIDQDKSDEALKTKAMDDAGGKTLNLESELGKEALDKLNKSIVEGKRVAFIEMSKDLIASKKQQDVAPSKTGHPEKMMAWRQETNQMFDDARSGSIQVSGSFNLEPVCGFSILFQDSQTGRDVIGYLVSKTDTIDYQAGVATTQYNVSNAELLVDIDYSQSHGASPLIIAYLSIKNI